MRILVAVLTMMLSLAACAEDQATQESYQAGTHYEVLATPVRTLDPNKVEVSEVFWYGCGHCFQFEPLIQQWKQDLSEDVIFRRSPAMWNADMETHARAFYTAKALGILDEVHQPLFNALNLQRKKLNTEESLAEFFADFGVDKERFMKTFKSFGVTSQVKQADARARSYKITGTPEMVVDGKYRISASLAGGHKEMLKVADFLVAKARADKP